ncbi:TIGR02285 family protein [Catenovulum agarivorans]|uniref:TIGR02285 family protein n=1 Tax=Catenovulum agarivorans TaxID=1172192 RepID=UPI00031DEB9C|nr:TIGR02285 family protein [Catenovulum agarivorans]
MLIRAKAVLLFVLVTFSVCCPSILHADTNKPEILWNSYNWAPFMITEGPSQGTGTLDSILALIQQNMPEYQHRKLEMNWARIYAYMKSGKPLCNIAAFKTPERETFAYFSNATMLVLPHAIVMRNQDTHKLNSPHSYSLAKLLSHPELQGQVESIRSYGKEIDQLIQLNANKLRFTTGESERNLKMLVNQRIDFYIEYPSVVKYTSQTTYNTSTHQDITTIKIKEAPKFLLGHVACTKSVWGQQVIRSVNSALHKLQTTEAYQRALTKWLTPLEAAEYVALYQQHILANAQIN